MLLSAFLFCSQIAVSAFHSNLTSHATHQKYYKCGTQYQFMSFKQIISLAVVISVFAFHVKKPHRKTFT